MFGSHYFGHGYFAEGFIELKDVTASAGSAVGSGAAKNASTFILPYNHVTAGDSLGYFSYGEPLPVAYGKTSSTGLDVFSRSEVVVFVVFSAATTPVDNATASGSSNVASSRLTINVDSANGLGFANDASVSLRSNLGVSLATGVLPVEAVWEAIGAATALAQGTASPPTVLILTQGIANAESAVAIGMALAPTGSLAAIAGLVNAIVAAQGITGSLGAVMDQAASMGTSYDPMGTIQMQAACSNGFGTAWSATIPSQHPETALDLIHGILVESVIRQHISVMEKVGELVTIE